MMRSRVLLMAVLVALSMTLAAAQGQTPDEAGSEEVVDLPDAPQTDISLPGSVNNTGTQVAGFIASSSSTGVDLASGILSTLSDAADTVGAGFSVAMDNLAGGQGEQ